MINENSYVEVKVGSMNQSWFKDRGYDVGKVGSSIMVKIKDLMPGSKAKIRATCDYCGEEYDTAYDRYYQMINNKYVQKCCCEKCYNRKMSEARLIKEREKVFEQLSKVCDENGYVLLTKKEEYKGVKQHCRFICPIHGEKSMPIYNLLHGRKCFECSYEDRFDNMRVSKDELIKRINTVNNNVLLNPEEYINCFTSNLLIKCGICNTHTFTTSLFYYEKGVNHCSMCSTISVGENNIKHILMQNDINFISQKRFDDCKNKRSLPFDFYLPDYNVLIEFDGEQHYFPAFGESSFEEVKKHDEIKNQYCKDNNIPLLRIPYWYRGHEEQLIKEFLNI